MKIIAALFLLFIPFICYAQSNDCIDRVLAKKGSWEKSLITNRATQADYAVQKRFVDAVHTQLSTYTPQGLQALWDASHLSPVYQQPVATYRYILRAMRYSCNGQELKLNHETNTKLTISFNNDFGRTVFDTVPNDNGAGFNVLREGIPQEIKPGIWLFKDVRTPLGFGITGITNYWLMTYPGQLPWLYVTRREFLLKRKKILQELLAQEEPRYKEKLQQWDVMKKYKEQEAKGDVAKLERFLNQDYKPGIERDKMNFDKSVKAFENAIARVEEQLAEKSTLDKPAVVIQSTSNYLDYDFVNTPGPSAQILVKPNPRYFKKGLPSSAPQLMEVAIQYDPADTVSAVFARTIQAEVDLAYLQSCIGKTAPPPSTGSFAAKNVTTSASTKTNEPVNSQQSVASAKNKETVAKPLTPQGPLARSQSLLTGTLSAPAGVSVTLGVGTNNDLIVTAPKGERNLYNSSSFKFLKPIKDNEEYNVLIKKMPAHLKGVIYKGSGKAPKDISDIKVGVDFTYELITRSTDDKAFSSFYESAAPAIGGMGTEEGRYVAFVSWTKGFAGNDGKYRQVFWRDRNTGETKLISVAPDGQPANADCNLPGLSADGQLLIFESKANNLVAGDNNNKKDIFLWRAQTNTIELVSRPSIGGSSDGDSYDASISGDGRFVVYTSDAANMSAVSKGRSLFNVFLRNLQESTTELLSLDPTTRAGGNGGKASISFDGSRVSFCSPSNTLVANDTNNLWDIFLWEKGKNGLRRISYTHDGKERNQGDESSSRQVWANLSGNGRYIVYATTATNMVPGDNAKYQDVFVYDIENKKLQVASFTDDGQPGNHDSPIEQGERMAINYDGTWVAFATKATNLGAQSSNIILFNTQTGKKTVVTNTRGSYVSRPVISYHGSYIVFGKSEALDTRSGAAFGGNGGGIFAHFTGNGPCRDCK